MTSVELKSYVHVSTKEIETLSKSPYYDLKNSRPHFLCFGGVLVENLEFSTHQSPLRSIAEVSSFRKATLNEIPVGLVQN